VVRFQPTGGSVLIFDHYIYHAGERVRSGVKYAIRTDVMYTNNGDGWDYSNRLHGPVVDAAEAERLPQPQEDKENDSSALRPAPI